MDDEYDADWDSPEARANFATRHIFNIYERKRKRDELLKQFQEEPVVEMFPRRHIRYDLERIKTELAWFMSQHLEEWERIEICQCGTESVIQRSDDPGRMRATLLSLVFFNQFVYTHYPQVHHAFRTEFPIPQLRGHSFGGHASPSWFVYPIHGYDKLADWEIISATFIGCLQHLRRWLMEHLERSVPELRGKIMQEVDIEFVKEHQPHFSAPIGG